MRRWALVFFAIGGLTGCGNDLTIPDQGSVLGGISSPLLAKEGGGGAVDSVGITNECSEIEMRYNACEPSYGGGGWPYFNDGDSNLYEAAGDPNPGQPGVWLGTSVNANSCFVTGDIDSDGLANHCEFPIARSFAPMLHYANGEQCPDGEPYWAARKMSIDRVRMVYLFSYYKDCGYGSHAGDSEAVMVDVQFNQTTQHWELVRMWTSAHYQAGEGCSDWYTGKCDFSEWSSASQTTFHSRHLGFPIVWVAKDKHANYRSIARCDDMYGNAIIGFNDECGSLDRIRTPVLENRNVGSKHLDLVACVPSVERTDSGGRTECFYTRRDKFRGWAPSTEAGNAGAYSDILYGPFEID